MKKYVPDTGALKTPWSALHPLPSLYMTWLSLMAWLELA